MIKRRKFFSFVGKILNFFVIKSRKRVYVAPHPNCHTDKYDLTNYSSDNVLCVLNYFKEKQIRFKSTFFVEYHHKDRLDILKEEIKKYPFKIKLILSHIAEEKRFKRFLLRLKNMFKRYRSKIWITDTGSGSYYDKLKCQTFICLCYATPLKVDGALMPKDMQYERWTYIDYFLQTSLLTACVHSAEFKLNLENCPILGYPRNDTLRKSPKFKEVFNWLSKKVDFEYDKIVVYAPTYRDYNGAFEDGCAFGFNNTPEELEEFLSSNKILLITKYHPLQKRLGNIFTKHIIEYEKNWNFSLYDLLSVCDALVSDYSSVIHDYVLTGKPVIINAFDYDKYENTRGFAFEPLDYILPSGVCRTFLELLGSLQQEINSKHRNEHYRMVQRMFHKYIDFNSTERVANYLMSYIK